MRDRGLSEEGAMSYIGSEGYEGRVAIVMRDLNLSEEEARVTLAVWVTTVA